MSQNFLNSILTMTKYSHFTLLALVLTLWLAKVNAQPADRNRLQVLEKKAYQVAVNSDPTKRMVDVNKLIPSLIMELRYATRNNFTGKRMYPSLSNNCYLREGVALALKAVSDSLLKKGFHLKIFDAYRPYAVTVRFWNLIRDPRYVANPNLGSEHNRGTAVDLTLVDGHSGKEIDMGTDFDDFSEAAHHSYGGHKAEVLENRKTLKETMEHFGFKSLETEWWHYSRPIPDRYPVLNVSFKALAVLTAKD